MVLLILKVAASIKAGRMRTGIVLAWDAQSLATYSRSGLCTTECVANCVTEFCSDMVC